MTVKTKYMFKNERDVKRRIKVLLEEHHWFWWSPAANGFGMTGVSDTCCLRGGVFMAVEAKFGSNKPSAQQILFLRSVQKQQGFAFVVNEKNIGWFDVFLQAFDKSAWAQAERREPAPEDGAAMLNAIRELMVWSADIAVDPPNPLNA